jgi:hypothetical protein
MVEPVELLVPHHLHAEMTVAACEAGKHVSVEKPLALTVAEADKMIETADRSSVVLRVYEKSNRATMLTTTGWRSLGTRGSCLSTAVRRTVDLP